MQTLKVKDIKIGKRHRKILGDIDALAASIAELGLLHPVVVTPGNKLAAGRRRLEAVKKLGWDDVPVRVVENLTDLLHELKAERDENACRLDPTPTEKVSLGGDIEQQERKEAKERQKQHGGTAPGRSKNTSGNFPGVNGKTADKVGEAVGMSGRTYEKAKKVIEAAKADPEKFGDLPGKMDATGKVDPVFKEMKDRANPTPPPKHFISDTVLEWLDLVHRKISGIRAQYGSWGEASKGKNWDKKRTLEIRQMLTALHHTLGELVEELA